MSTVEYLIGEMNFHRVQKKGYELSSQQYEQETKVPYKKEKTLLLKNKSTLTCMIKEKATIQKITSPAMMEACEVINECPDYTSPVMMENCVNDEHEDSIRKYLVEKNDTKVTDEVQEISIET